MNAIIIAAGSGKRISNDVRHTPKSLLKVNNKTLLDHQIEALNKVGIKNITLIVGPYSEKFDSKNTWPSFLISTKFLNSLNLQSDLVVKIENFDCAYTGISIINANKITDLNEIEQSYIILDDKRIAFNLNTNEDYRLLNSF